MNPCFSRTMFDDRLGFESPCYLLRRLPQPAVCELMARLQARKTEVDRQLREQSASARFAPRAPTDAEQVLPPPVARVPETKPGPDRESLTTDPPEVELHTSRLLKAKQKVWRDREGPDAE